MFEIMPQWLQAFPGACAGALVMHGVENPPTHAGLEEQKRLLEEELRARFGSQGRKELDADPVLQAYADTYRRFDKTYHVRLQLESIVHKGRALPSVAALVEAMFMAEMGSLLLTAGHDLDALRLPVQVRVGAAGEVYTVLRGQEQAVKAGDMLMADGEGIISTVLYGPDQRTRITSATRNVIFTVYAPAGIAPRRVQAHLEQIESYVRLITPAAVTGLLVVLGGG